MAKALKGNAQTGRAFHVTIAVYKKKILAIGINNYNRTVYRTRFGKYKVDGVKSYIPSMHSEISCLLKVGREDCSDIEFFNIRIDNNNKPAASFPCSNCLNTLNQVGFKKIYYINENGKVALV